MPLSSLPGATVMAMTTLYIPPRGSRALSGTVSRWFDEQ
jgi:hypothetical protein